MSEHENDDAVDGANAAETEQPQPTADPATPAEPDDAVHRAAPDAPADPEPADGGQDDGVDYGVRDLGAPRQDVTHPVAGKTFDPDPARERIRGGLAVATFVLFAAFSLGIAVVVSAGWRTWNDIEGMTGTLLPAIVSVLGTTTGFYFGTKAGESG